MLSGFLERFLQQLSALGVVCLGFAVIVRFTFSDILDGPKLPKDYGDPPRPDEVKAHHAAEAIRIFELRQKRKEGIESKARALLVIAGIGISVLAAHLEDLQGASLRLGAGACFALFAAVFLLLTYFRLGKQMYPVIDKDALALDDSDFFWEIVIVSARCISSNEESTDFRADLFTASRRYLLLAGLLLFSVMVIALASHWNVQAGCPRAVI